MVVVFQRKVRGESDCFKLIGMQQKLKYLIMTKVCTSLNAQDIEPQSAEPGIYSSRGLLLLAKNRKPGATARMGSPVLHNIGLEKCCLVRVLISVAGFG